MDGAIRRSIALALDLIDTGAITTVWERALSATTWDRPPVWVHRDVANGNLLVRGGRICAVIDWSGVALGDPALDVRVAWELFEAESREVPRAELDLDDPTWDRSRGWALFAVEGLNYYLHTNPVMVSQARRTLAAVLNAAPVGERSMVRALAVPDWGTYVRRLWDVCRS